ncbi:ABC transporter substrate-binding protein [Salirhabdus salicampi]|uniref:ABC transporter substrate-binding protein n=1 Tax=Salirhabdus salicampi TaxID=476102 RepID=UPI0020C48DBA|nr:ABC transporter substrate-binding protein [Salirhabdus salicampi]MCP8615529.1 ABC transporter substrate-binding protein [Salirhabdus salicampi]
MKKLLMMMMTSILIFAVACGTTETENENGESNSGDGDVVIGVTQIVEHPSLDAAFEGFKQALVDGGINASYDVNIAQGDSSNNDAIAKKLADDEVDLIFANSTPSALSALNATKEIPIIFTSVTDPVGSELVETMEKPGGNVTGTSDSNPDAIPSTIQLIKDMGYESVGVVYNSGESNSVAQINAVKEYASDNNVNVEEAVVSTSAEVKQATESLVGDVDALYIITDNTVVSALESVLIVGHQEDIPVFVGELDSVERGGFAAYGFSYYDIGYEAGEKTVQILNGEKEPGEIPATFPQTLQLTINEEAAEEMGVELTDELKDLATDIVTTQQD